MLKRFQIHSKQVICHAARTVTLVLILKLSVDAYTAKEIVAESICFYEPMYEDPSFDKK
jgi:hypothetical protein